MKIFKEYGSQLAILLIALVAIVGGVIFFGGSDDDAVENEEAEDTALMLPTETSDPNTSQPADGVEAPTNRESIELVAVNDYDASGEASRSYDESNGFMHEVIAEMPEPPEGKFYEGWLTDGSRVESTGAFELEEGTTWSLVFSSEEDLSGLERVVITEETSADGLDGVPEIHVLEGSF